MRGGVPHDRTQVQEAHQAGTPLSTKTFRIQRPLTIPNIKYQRLPLAPEDRAWLLTLFDQVWLKNVPIEARPLTQEELGRVVTIIKSATLPCVMGSGPYGDLSISVYEHVDVPTVKPEMIFGFHERHLSWGGVWNSMFNELSKLTHTKENTSICKFYQLPLPEARERYEY